VIVTDNTSYHSIILDKVPSSQTRKLHSKNLPYYPTQAELSYWNWWGNRL